MTPRTRNLLAVALAVLVLAAVVVGGFAGRRVLDARHDEAAGDDAVAAASQLGVNFTTLDYQSFDRDSGRVLAGATGEFKKEFSAQSAELKSWSPRTRRSARARCSPPGWSATTRTAPGCCSSWTPT